MAYPPPPEQVDGWTDLQHQLDARNFTLSRTFTIVFILLASFIFLSMFVGVMIDPVKEAQPSPLAKVYPRAQPGLLGDCRPLLSLWSL